MRPDEPLFELRGPAGEVWRLYTDGHMDGFPPGTILVNRAKPLLDALRSAMNPEERDCATLGDLIRLTPEIVEKSKVPSRQEMESIARSVFRVGQDTVSDAEDWRRGARVVSCSSVSMRPTSTEHHFPDGSSLTTALNGETVDEIVSVPSRQEGAGASVDVHTRPATKEERERFDIERTYYTGEAVERSRIEVRSGPIDPVYFTDSVDVTGNGSAPCSSACSLDPASPAVDRSTLEHRQGVAATEATDTAPADPASRGSGEQA